MTDTEAAIKAHRAYLDLLDSYNRIVDYIDSPQLVKDFRSVMGEPGHAIGDAQFTAAHLAVCLRGHIHDRCTDGWQPLPDADHDAPPEIHDGPIWLATSRGTVVPGYFDTRDSAPTAWDPSRSLDGRVQWWRPMDIEPPTINVNGPPPIAHESLTSVAEPGFPPAPTHAVGYVAMVRDRWIEVHLDGDDDGETVGCRNKSGEELTAGDRVTVRFVPPHTVYVVDKLKGDPRRWRRNLGYGARVR